MWRPVERRTFWLLAALGVAARLALIATTYGTNDAGFVAAIVDLLKRAGIAGSYAHTAMMNHPPLSSAYMMAIDRIAGVIGVAFVDVFRFFQVMADVVSAAALFHIGRTVSVEHGRALALFLLLSPGAAFISAFHCNTDATMVALILVAALLVAYHRDVMAGVVLALAGGIKILPFLLVPVFAVTVRRRAGFILAFLATAAATFLPAILLGGAVVVRGIFGYRGGLPYEWGVSGVAFAASRNVPAFRSMAEALMLFWRAAGSYFTYAGIVAVLILTLRKRPTTTNSMLHAVEIMFLTVLALAPGFGVQYIGWLVAFLPFAFSWRGAIAMNAAISTFLFVTYTVWSGGWPWFFADIARPGPHRWVAAVAGDVMWLIVCAALIVAVRGFINKTRSETTS